MTNTATKGTDWESLLASPVPGSKFNGWVMMHNRAVTAWGKWDIGASQDLHRNERAILSLMMGIDQYVGSNAEYLDPYTGPNVIASLLDAVDNALNLDLGRLDGGTLSAWVERMRARAGIDENGGWVGWE